MNTSLINDTNTKLNDIIENIKSIKNEYEARLTNNKASIDDELAKVDEYKNLFYEAKKKIQKMSDDINGFEEDYRNLVEKFQDDELSNILTGVSKEINTKIKEKKRSIQKDQEEMNTLIDKAQEAKKSLVKLTAEKKALEVALRQITDVYKYYDEEFEKISTYTAEHFDNLHPDENAFAVDSVEEEINIDDIEIDEKEEIVTDEDINNTVVEDEDIQEEIIEEDNNDEEIEEIENLENEDNMEEYVTNEEFNEEETTDEVVDDVEEIEDVETDDEVTDEVIEEEAPIDFDIEDVVVNDDLDEDDDEESIKSFLNKDENDFREE